MAQVPTELGSVLGLSHAPVAPEVQSESLLHWPPVSGRRFRSQPEQSSWLRAPAIWTVDAQLRDAVLRATKSKSSRTSVPESSIFVVVLSNGKTLKRSVMATGP